MCLEQVKTLSAERNQKEPALIKIRVDSSLSQLYLSNNTVELKGSQALPMKPKSQKRKNRPVKRGVKEKQGRREEREKRSFQGSAIKIKRSTTSCLSLPFWFYQCFLTFITLDSDLSLVAGFPS